MTKELQKKLTIGLILDRLEETYQALVWPGIADYAKKSGINLIIFVGSALGDLYKYHLNYNIIGGIVSRENIDGLVIMSGAIANLYKPEEIKAFSDKFKHLPVVSIAMKLAGIPSILIDNKSGVADTVTHLIEHHRYQNIAFIKGPEGFDEAEDRFNAYKETLAKHNIPFDPNLVAPGNFTQNSGRDAVMLFLDKRKVKVDAIVAVDDDTALGVLNELHKREIMVPNDIAVTGFDDTDEAKLLMPPLTTVKQQFYEQGKSAIETLISVINGNWVESEIYLPTQMVIRESCGCLSKTMVHVKDYSEKRGSTENNECITEETIREIVMPEILSEFKDAAIDPGEVKEWIGMLLRALSTYLVDTHEEQFMYTLNKVLLKYLHFSDDMSYWHIALSIVRNAYYEKCPYSGNTSKIEYIFQKARILLSEINTRNQILIKSQLKNRIWLLRQISQNLIITFNMATLLDVIEEGLKQLEIPSCYIVLYHQTLITRKRKKWVVPEDAKLIFAYKDRKRIKISDEGINFNPKYLLPDCIGFHQCITTNIFMPLFFNDDQYGFIIFEYGTDDKIVYETLRGHISSAIKGAMLFKEQKETEIKLKVTLEKLEELNNELKTLSIKDELTSLYNRRGFFQYAEKQYQVAKRLKHSFLLFFIDLDRLKYINDTFGHKEGDIAIISTAEILRRTFRKIDIIARLGGDEFTVLVLNATKDDLPSIKKRLKANIGAYNDASQKPYSISMSVGEAFYCGDCKRSFDEIVASADQHLYNEKLKKKDNVKIKNKKDRIPI